ncbi:MAG: LVIVD repeat-containing protein [Candidatus Hodarchaeales archaeon]
MKRTGDVYINESSIGVMNSEAGSVGIYNFSNPMNPSEIAQKFTNGQDQSLFLYRDHVYIASGSYGIGIIDIRDLSNISEPLYVDTNGGCNDLVVINDFIFAADGSSLAIVNVTDPLNPGPVNYQTAEYADHIFIYKGFAYMTCGSKIGIVDISDPSNPSGIFYKDDFGGYGLNGIYVYNDLAFVAVDHKALAIFNVTDPWNPSVPIFIDIELIDIIDLRPSDIYVRNDVVILLISDGNNEYSGLVAIDISDLNNLKKIIWEELNLRDAYHLGFHNNYLYIIGRDIVDYKEEAYLIITDINGILNWESPVTAQSSSIYQGGNVRNVTIQANQTLYSNTSIDHYVSFDKTNWFPVTLNETHSFPANIDNDLYWRADLSAEENQTQSPIIDSILILYEVYYEDASATTTVETTVTTETTTETTTTKEPTITIPPGETHNYDFSNMNEFNFSISTSLSSASTQIILNNLQTGRELQITITPRLTPRLGQIFALLSISKTQSEIDWQLIDSQERIRLSVTQSNSETKTESMTIDTSGSWRLAFHWDNSTETTTFDCNVRQFPMSTYPQQIFDFKLLLALSIVIILLSAFGFVLYKTITVWSKEWQKRPEKETMVVTKRQIESKKGAVDYSQTHIDLPLFDEKTKKILLYGGIAVIAFIVTTFLLQNFFLFWIIIIPIYFIVSYMTGEEAKERKRQKTQQIQYLQSEVKQLKRERETIKTPIVKQIEDYSLKPTDRRSFFCQLDNAQHPKTDSGYQCENCSRMVCAECYEKSLKVDVPECPFCDGTLNRIQ